MGFSPLVTTKRRRQGLFNVILSFWTLSWVKDQTIAFSNISNALKPDGKLLIMYPLRHDTYDIAEALIKQSQWQGFFKNKFQLRPFMTEEQYMNTCHSEYMETSVIKKEILCHFSSAAEMHASIRSWMSHLDVLPNEELKQAFLIDFTEAYLKHRGLSEPIMFFSVLEVSGKKKAPYLTARM